MIESIQIKNFRGIQTGQVDRFRKFNLLVGPNNSGKSAVLEAIYLSSTANRGAGLEIHSGKHSEYEIKIPDRDFLGDDPMMRILARHNYARTQTQINQGSLEVSISSSQAPLRRFKISHAVKPRGEETDVSLFGFRYSDNHRGILKKQDIFGDPFELASLLWG